MERRRDALTAVVVGVGGVGTHLVGPLCRYLSVEHPGSSVVLVDGDQFSESNAERQDFDPADTGGNKAEAKVAEIAGKFPSLGFRAVDLYLDENNVGDVVPEGSVVFCCVDNHPSRKVLSDRMSSMANGVLLSGGNEFHDGNAQVHLRRAGADVTPPITHFHPEIEFPQGKNPARMTCEELAAASAPQLIFANLEVATKLLTTFWVVQTGGDIPPYNEVYFDIKKGTQRPVSRTVIKESMEKEDGPKAEDVDLAAGDRPGRVA